MKAEREHKSKGVLKLQGPPSYARRSAKQKLQDLITVGRGDEEQLLWMSRLSSDDLWLLTIASETLMLDENQFRNKDFWFTDEFFQTLANWRFPSQSLHGFPGNF